MEFNATRCLTISFSAAHEIPENVETDSAHESIKSSILNHCEKFGQVEDFVFDIKSSKDICGKVVVHFCSIDSAIKTYENLSKRINQNSRYDRKENSHSDTTNASSTKSFNSLNDIRFSGVEFGKDRCDKTPYIQKDQSYILHHRKIIFNAFQKMKRQAQKINPKTFRI